MDIVLEGPDNSGKSTLGQKIAEVLGRQYIPSEGREKFPGEINDRVARYLAEFRGVVFDRHPCISQEIYNIIKENTRVSKGLMKEFYNRRPLIIYCRPVKGRGMEGHVAKDYDSPEYLHSIEKSYDQLTICYDEWALQNAQLMYRIGDDVETFIKMVKGAIA